MEDSMEKLKSNISMFYEANRLATFKKWPISNDKACNAVKMAEAGFFYVGTSGNPDCVECFLCKKNLDGWEEEDDPWQEHLKHAKNCQFAKLGKAERFLPIEQLIELKKTSLNNEVVAFGEEIMDLKKKRSKLLMSATKNILTSRKRL